jgi:asparagine synthase (glutamine-hydrolysing)
MVATMKHRGPDDQGLLLAPPAVLGMRRLSIIDLTGGHQPAFNEDGTIAVVFNGEIYNFQELRQTLERKGHIFRSRSDTETIVHAYEAWGPDCTHHLRGMFAFAAVEMPERKAATRIFLARDRFGIKPLYYAFQDGAFLFASELRALLASGCFAARLSVSALESYLHFGSVGEPMTLVAGIHSLPPGHWMAVPLDRSALPIRPERYWDLVAAAARSRKPAVSDRHEALAEVRRRLEDAIRGHLIADVPLGIFLSSGIDSAALAGLASRERAGVHTFTLVFSEQEFSEALLARQIAARLGTRHEELLLTGEEMLSRLGKAITALDQPSMDGMNTYFVSWAARQAGLKVALSGLGGDEVFGGYSTFRSAPRVAALVGAIRSWPAPLRRGLARALTKIGAANGFADRSRKLAAACAAPDALPHPYFFLRSLFTPAQVSELLQSAALPEDRPWRDWLTASAHEADQLDSFTKISWLESRSYLVNTLLRDTDAMSMAHSLEVRVPFLDHPLLEFIAQLPEDLKRPRGTQKRLLVEALGNLLPRDVVCQRKRTFTLPWEHWLRGGLRKRIEAGLSQLAPSLRPVLSAASVRAVWNDFLAGRTSWSRPWSLYVLNQWAARHLDREVMAPLDGGTESLVVQARSGAG